VELPADEFEHCRAILARQRRMGTLVYLASAPEAARSLASTLRAAIRRESPRRQATQPCRARCGARANGWWGSSNDLSSWASSTDAPGRRPANEPQAPATTRRVCTSISTRPFSCASDGSSGIAKTAVAGPFLRVSDGIRTHDCLHINPALIENTALQREILRWC
jgi:hypothetical protein